MDMIQDIDDFHKKFGFTKRELGVRPDPIFMAFRLKFLAEELHETLRAARQDDMENFLDGLVDLVYVAIGSAWSLNLNFDEAWKRVHEANMKKVRAERVEDSKRGTVFDVVKPKGWQKPDVAGVINELDKVLKHSVAKQAKSGQLDLVEYLKTLEQGEQP
jgi:predicted HAD superfamily Cof-like phosphohydrolase